MKSTLQIHWVFIQIILLSNGSLLIEGVVGHVTPDVKSLPKEVFPKDDNQNSRIINLLETIESKIDNLQKDLNKNTDLLEATKDAEKADEDFWASKDTCGGTIVSQTGRIGAKSSSPQKCVWTVRVNHRSQIKLNLHHNDNPENLEINRANYYGYDRGGGSVKWSSCKVFELKFGRRGPGGNQSFEVTDIYYKTTYVFKGPIIFISCYVRSYDSSNFITFEGFGPLVNRNIAFKNLHSHKHSGSINLTLLAESNSKEMEYTTLQFDSYHSFELKKRKISIHGDIHSLCKNEKLSLYMYENFTSRYYPIYNCCEIDCTRKTFLATDDFFLITIWSATVGNTTSTSKLTWHPDEHSAHVSETEVQYGLSFVESSCGGIISGQQSGFIKKYGIKNNQRCVWIIHPFPYRAINVYVETSSMVDYNKDYAVAVEIDQEEPITTRLSAKNDYFLSGRVILIMLYSDETVSGGSFYFSWEAGGATNASMLAVDNKLFRSTLQSGNKTFETSLSSEPIKNLGLHTFVVNPQDMGPHWLNLTIDDLKLEGEAKLRILGSKNANFSVFSNILSSETNAVGQRFQSYDGVFIIILEIEEYSSNGSFAISWEQGPSILLPQYNGCGGTVNAAAGSIYYHVDSLYPYNDRCIWILHCPFKSVTFTLRKQQFACCEDSRDSISVVPINFENGEILSNQTSTMSSTNQTETFDGPLLILTFQSGRVKTGKGFALDFTGSGAKIDLEHRFRMIHSNERQGTFLYPSLDEKPLKSSEMLLLAYSNVPIVSPSGYTSTRVNRTEIKSSKILMSLQINSESLQRRFQTGLDQIQIFSHPGVKNFESVVECSIGYGAPENECNFNVAYTMPNISKENSANESGQFDFGINFSAFLLTYKPATSTIQTFGFNLTWEDDTSCGGTHIGESGIIQYKLFEKYQSHENCVWIIESPGKKNIHFKIISSGLDNDMQNPGSLIINSVLAQNGEMGASQLMGHLYYQSQSLTIKGSVAIVTFFSKEDSKGTGFKLMFTGVGDLTKAEDKFQFRHVISKAYGSGHSALTIPSKFQSPMKINEIIILVFNPLRINGTPSNHSENTTVRIKDLNMFVHPTYCQSDSLMFFTFQKHRYFRVVSENNKWTGAYRLRKAFRSYRNSSFCDQTEDGSITTYQNSNYQTRVNQKCEPECYNTDVKATSKAQDLIFNVSVPVIVFYMSVTNQSIDQKAIDLVFE